MKYKYIIGFVTLLFIGLVLYVEHNAATPVFNQGDKVTLQDSHGEGVVIYATWCIYTCEYGVRFKTNEIVLFREFELKAMEK